MNNQRIFLEHANLTVNDINESVKFFKTAFPHFKIRGGGQSEREWIHLGDDTTYIAINRADTENQQVIKNYNRVGINHIGFVVENVDEIADRLITAGFKRDFPKQVEQYRIRDYFADTDGNQYEFVQYLSDDIKERNEY